MNTEQQITWEQAREEAKLIESRIRYNVLHSFHKKEKWMPAETLYNVRCSNPHLMNEHPDKVEILEDFCKAYWGCTFDELMKYWDEYLG